MKTEAKGKPEQLSKQAGRIPIDVFSTERWTPRIKVTVPQQEECGFTIPVSQLLSRELNLGEMVSAVYRKLAA